MKEIEFELFYCEIRGKESIPKFIVFLKEKGNTKKFKMKFPAVDFISLVTTMIQKNLKEIGNFLELFSKIFPDIVPKIKQENEIDLFVSIMDKLETKVVKCVMTDFVNNTLKAIIVLRQKNHPEELTLSCRPSEGILLAFKSDAPIYLTEEVLEKCPHSPNQQIKNDELKNHIKEIKPEDFGKYPLT